jgi:LPS-assembly protein
MFYMADRLVTLQQGDNKVADIPGTTDKFSPVMSSFEYQILKSVYFTGQVNYSVQNKKVDYQIYGLQYKDENENIFNVAYNNIANNWASMTQDQINRGDSPIAQETITVSTLLNITDHWGIAALWNYNFEQKKTANAFVGLQYQSKSWALRGLVEAGSYTNQNPNDPVTLADLTYTYSLELELKGIGGMGGGDGMASQLHQITGYEDGEWGTVS